MVVTIILGLAGCGGPCLDSQNLENEGMRIRGSNPCLAK